jgi:hypothetical protein
MRLSRKGGSFKIIKTVSFDRKVKRMDRILIRLTRMRVLHREVELTGRNAGKIERSAEALLTQTGLHFPSSNIN